MPPIVLVRGAPGSGKSTICRRIAESLGFDHFEADMYHTENGVFRFESWRAADAHEWCRTMTQRSMAMGRGVAIGNPLLDLYAMMDYLDMSDDVIVVSLMHRYGSLHAPPHISMRMREEFEHHDEFRDLLPSHVRPMTETQLNQWISDRGAGVSRSAHLYDPDAVIRPMKTTRVEHDR